MNEMPSKKQYDLVSDDGYDSRIPLHNEEAFAHGIQFGAKYIGTLDVPRPSSRVEIVAAMRRIRYEFKAKAIKKKKVTLTVSVDGVKVMMRKKKKKSQWHWDDNRLMVMQHPIYRIFYVSHDSQDLKIWSYIARDGSTNVFKCNVFKAYKKNQAMRIVRTIGQAFEVCHKLSVQNLNNSSENPDEDGSEHSNESEQKSKSKEALESDAKGDDSMSSPVSQKSSIPPTDLALKQAQQLLQSMGANTPGETITSPLGSPVLLGDVSPNPELPLSSHHQMQLLRQQLEQQQQQTQVAIAQVHLLKDQLAAETAARIEAQARAHQLLLHNRDLLDHVATLINRVQDFEMKVNGISSASEILFQTPPQVQIPVLPDPTTPQSGPVYLPEFRELDMSYLQTVPESAMFKNTKTDLDTDSPDSGHKEMSSDSLSFNLQQPENVSWHSTTVNNGSGLSETSGKTPPNTSMECSLNGYHTPPSQGRQPRNGHVPESFNQSHNIYNPFSHSDSSRNSSSIYNSTPSPSFGKDENVKIITPLPPQDASGNRIDLSIQSRTPKIEPPPKNKRSIRPGHMNLNMDNTIYHDTNANIAADSDYCSNYTTSTVDSASICDATPGTWASLCREFANKREVSWGKNHSSSISREENENFIQKNDDKTNDINAKNSHVSIKDVIDTRLHITSPSDDENTENSEDSGILPHNMPRRLDSMTFDEFDALSN